MAYIKKLKYNELVGGTDNTDVYPVTSTEAVYGPDNINQQVVNEDRLRRIELLEKNVHSLDGLKEMVEAFISGDYDSQGGLSDNNFTDELKAKLDGLENYNDAELRQLLADIDTAKANAEDVYTKSEIDDKLGDIQGALTFDNTPIAGSDNPVKSSGIYTALQGKQDTISDLNDIRTHASEFSNSPAASITSTNINSWNQAAEGGGTITGITMNGSSKGTSGVVDLGTVVTQETDPTVPQWAKAANKPAYTAQEVGALPADTQFKTINNESILGNTDISIPADVYSKNESDSRYLKNADATSTYATKSYVSDALANVVYIGDDDGQATTLTFDPQADTVWNIPQTLGSSQQAQARANIGVVDVSGTNDGTNWTSITIGSTTKAIPSGGSGGGGGETNVIESISINGTTQTVTNKNVDLPVPTSSTITAIVSLTEAQYTNLSTKDSATLYVILES